MLSRLAAGLLAALLLAALPGCCCCVPALQNPGPQQPIPNAPDAEPIAQAPPPVFAPAPAPPPPEKKPEKKPNEPPVPPEKKVKPPPVVQPEPDDEPVGPKLEADPLRAPLQPLVNPMATLPLPANKQNLPVRYPWLPSPIVGVAAQKKKSEASWEVWNLQSMKQLGTVPGSTGANVLLSTDGAYVAMPSYPPGKVTAKAMQIYSVADGQVLHKLPAMFSIDSRAGTTDFIGPDQFLALHTANQGGLVKIWDVKTGAQIGMFGTEGMVDRRRVAVSAGGRYLATYEPIEPKRGIYIYELPAGKLVRKIRPKYPPTSFYTMQGLAFSHDGKELAALATADKGIDSLQAWDFETGKRTANHTFSPALVKTAQNAQFYPVDLEWLPDRSGWFAYGQLMIDHDRGKIFWRLPPDDPQVSWQRRFADADHLVTVLTQQPPWRVGMIALPKDEIAAARKK